MTFPNPMTKSLWRPWSSARAAWLSLLLAPVVSVRGGVDFALQVRPILSENCFACHGPDEAQRQGKLRLDTKEGALGDRGGYPVIVAGDPESSELLVRVTTEEGRDLMPPLESGKSLTEEEVGILRQWVLEGAVWEEHWAFLPIEQPAVPTVEGGGEGGMGNPIDAFVRARLAREGLEPAEPAGREVLLRRVTLDLTGIPPSLGEVEAFLADDGQDAYERVVDRLLGSPRYGEHMARYWLDAARYGDTHGLHLDNYREMWPYRDWVVAAFNGNKPYDDFVIEQLAGDLLEGSTEEQLIATGFIRCHVTTTEGGSIEEEVEMRNVVDRVVTVGTAFMGLTLDCTRCHDHKFDPLTMGDFYSMYAYFNSLDGSPMDGNRKDPQPVLEVLNTEQKRVRRELTEAIARHEARLGADWPVVDGEQEEWERALRAELAPRRPVLSVEGFTAGEVEADYLEAEKLEAESIVTESFEVPR